ncbi:50S ribosomal protein L15, chloroplastic-like [Neltuma alba]|uniref:50S ribosomal protein L15, chloroplastic-like n=1 Tax=Neltuma alba TaxID=207710 RepID=UPI0010A4295A|nr:50S ribosomal protein L15, chloroplastic-like [Prosopis alba]XP_028783361.1 50S ribosomal protein L15, chloroplastic-like [Prosopis alba]
MYTSAAMASLLSLTPSPLVAKPAKYPSLASPFKGRLETLAAKPCSIPSLKIHRISREKRPLVILNQAASSSAVVTLTTERFRLNNLGPQPGSRKKAKRKGRGISAGQGASCGFGMRGQKSRSGPGVRKGFEGGQMPLYRRIPKLRGIAGGMHAGLPKYVHVNLRDIEDAGFKNGEEVSLETLKDKGVINPSGRDRRLPLKILGEGELRKKLTIKARAFSTSAKEKLESVGCSLTVLPGRKKWVKPSVAKNLARAEEYFAKKRAAAASEPASA